MTPTPKDESEFKVIIRGVRGSYPVCGKKYLKYGGNTTSYEVWADNCLIIVDAGTGIINLGHDLMSLYLKSGSDVESRTPIEAIILFSHINIDHLQGLPFFSPIFLPDSTFYIYGPDFSDYNFEDAINSAISPPYYPISMIDMYALKLFRSLSQDEAIYWDSKKGIPTVVNTFREFERKKQALKNSSIQITCMKSYAHPNEGVLIFRIEFNNKAVVIATDTEGYVDGDTRLINFSKNADLLLHDAGYVSQVYKSLNNCKQGFGHSTMEMAVEVAKKAKVKRLGLLHHEPANDDKVVDAVEKKSQKLFPNSFAAYEDQKIIL
ncbi:hypothetical protein AMJ80_09500 [bacterium SM23_31]|nr:MAG: hypothetical protein AMJ80_09500 [bacterium SM23_31]